VTKINYKALLIGNSKFDEDPHNLLELKGPPNDVRALEETLTHPQVGMYDTSNVEIILDFSNWEIMKKLDDFFQSAKRDDQLLLYYSGHGYLDKYSNLYLCARNTKINNLISTAIPDSAINTMIENSSSKRVVIILDCCHSGKFKGGGDIPQNLQGEGRFVITSSRSRELSQDAISKETNSPFTKHFVAALLSSEVDVNRDNYVSINEVYDYILPRLHDETKQNPQRSFDQAIGELAIGKSITVKQKVTSNKPGGRTRPPRLAVSESLIEIKDVMPGERLPEDIIDVFNEGGGELNWTVDCDDDWIEIKKEKGFFKLKLNPKPGMNRGRIYVRDRASGSSKRVRVVVKVNETPEPPKLVLSAKEVNFGCITYDAKPPKTTIRLNNTGGGELNAKVTSLGDFLKVKLIGDLVEITPDVSETGAQQGQILIETDGGTATIPVFAEIEKGPVLEIDKEQVDFGTVKEGESISKKIRISNGGTSKLKWECEQRGNFFQITKSGELLKVTLDAQPGRYHGSIILKSNGGDCTVDVRAKVKAAKKSSQKSKIKQKHVNISGHWNAGEGIIQITGSGSYYNYQEFNLLGVIVGEGSANVYENKVSITGHNIMVGPITGQLEVHGNIMSGYINSMGINRSIIFTRVSNAIIPGFNLF